MAPAVSKTIVFDVLFQAGSCIPMDYITKLQIKPKTGPKAVKNVSHITAI